MTLICLKSQLTDYRCTKNCLSKVAVASPHALRGVCSNCESSGLKKLRSKWKLWVEKETSADVFVEVANFTNMTGITGNLQIDFYVKKSITSLIEVKE